MTEMSAALHPIETKILLALAPVDSLSFPALVEKTSLMEDQVRRALQWLASKGMVSIEDRVSSRLEVVREPPEVALFNRIVQAGNPLTGEELRAGFEPSEFSAAFGRAKGAGWIRVDGSPATVRVSNQDAVRSITALLDMVSTGGSKESISAESGPVADFLKRGVLRKVESHSMTVKITDLGKRSASPPVPERLIEKLTPEILVSGAWRGKNLRPIDVEAESPRFHPGRRHPVRDFIREVREVYISMGFTELRGESIHPGFWNFDALFIPLVHPSREMQDTFYLEG